MTNLINQLMEKPLFGDVTLGSLLSSDTMLGFAQSVLGALVILFLGYVVAGWGARAIRRLGFRYESLDDTLFSFFANIYRYVVLGLTVLVVLNSFGIQTTSFVAVIGAASLAIGLALQGTLSNVAAGVMIVFFRPFKLGDFIETNGVSGTVKDITLNYTELADLSNVQVIVPNGIVWGNTITNFSANKTRRAEMVFGVSYSADLKLAEKTIRETIFKDARAKTSPEPFLQVNNLGDFSVDFLVRVWVKADDYFGFQSDMKRQVKEALDQAGVEIPFPTTTIINEGA